MSISNILINESTYTDLKVKSVSCDQIICNSHNSNGEMIIPVIPISDPLPTPENGSIISYNDGTGYEFWYCDGVAWHKVSGVTGTGDVQGPAGASDSHLTLYDGVTGKVIKNSNVKLTGVQFQGFDALNNPIPIEFNGDTDHLGFDIANVGSIAPDTVNTNLITPKTGTFISFNNKDITNVNTVVSTNVNTDFIGSATGSIIEFIDKPQSATLPSVDGDLTNRLYVETRLGNFYAGLTDSATISGTTLGSLIPLLGDGTLTVPPGGFGIGDSFHLVVAGTGVFQNGNTLNVSLTNGGTLGSITIDLENANPTSWELEADFTIRSIGVAGSISTNFDFTYQRPSPSFDFRGARQVQTSAIDTTVSNTLGVDAQFSGGVNSMTASLFYLKKTH